MDIFSTRQRIPRFNPRPTTLRQSKLYNEATENSGLSLAYLGHGQPLAGRFLYCLVVCCQHLPTLDGF